MTTEAQVQAELATLITGAKIEKSDTGGSSTYNNFYSIGGVSYPGKARWTQCSAALSAASQAARIVTTLST
jgi:hypothetical protein